MNPTTRWSEEQVHAFVDGELDAAETARLAALMQEDPALADCVARQRALRTELAAAFAPVLDEALPARLLQALDATNSAATPIGAARRPRHRVVAARPLWWGAAAASVLIAAIIGWSLPRNAGGLLVPGQDGLLAAGALAEALSERIAVDGSAADHVRISLSFRATDGRYCRSFSLDSGLDGLACHDERGWQIEAIGRQPANSAQSTDDYRQASAAFSPAVLAAISGAQQGESLSPDEEREARERRWRQN
jgi:hypothetical protein